MANEIRFDPLSGLAVVIASDRATRPGHIKASFHQPEIDTTKDPFMPGNEDQTPPTLFTIAGRETPWQTRVFENLYPTLKPTVEELSSSTFFQAQAATGAHEVIVNCGRPVTQLAQLTDSELHAAVSTWQQRIREHQQSAYTHLIVNEGEIAGASLPHTHAQLFALPFVPPHISAELKQFSQYATNNAGKNLLQDLVAAELSHKERIIAANEETVLFAPYASRLPYELTIAPRKATANFFDWDVDIQHLASALRGLSKLFGTSPPLNLWVRTAPQGVKDYCWQITIVPRLSYLAGLELGTGIYVNTVPPELAAANLREALGKS